MVIEIQQVSHYRVEILYSSQKDPNEILYQKGVLGETSFT